jgi:putative ABC transport system substrate-binding protein
MKRRDFIAGLGGAAAAWPVGAWAQSSTTPVIGVLSGGSLASQGEFLSAFLRSLGHAGYEDGRNVTLEYRWANDRLERLPAMAADLARRNVAVLVSLAGTITVLAAKSVTQSIPIVFVTGGDPVKAGIVASLNRPGGNITGITVMGGALNGKRLELLRETVPSAFTIGVLHNPNNPNVEPDIERLQSIGAPLGIKFLILEAANEHDIDTAFAEMVRQKINALLMLPDPFLNGRAAQLVSLARIYSIPTIYGYREFTAAGGLMSYGTSQNDARRLAALQVARILRGEKPSDLPVQQSTKVELVINLKTAKAQGLTFPLSLLGRADEVIE